MQQINATWIFSATRDWLTEPDAPRVLIHRGGTRSGKTYNACIAWATYLAEHDERLSIVRKTLPALKASVLEDMVEVLEWIVDRYEGSEGARWYTSTYKDNPFLPDEQRREIENLKHTDPWAWKVYGLGERARPAASIYRDVEPLPGSLDRFEPDVYGLDFGYNDPMVLVAVTRHDKHPKPVLDVSCLLHESHLTTSDLTSRMDELGVSTSLPIICDSAEPDRIEQLQRAGYNAQPAKKGQGSVKAGIDYVKQHKLRIGGPEGDKARREHRNYRWQTRQNGDPLDEPVDTDDHAPDAVRYAAHRHYAGSQPGFVVA